VSLTLKLYSDFICPFCFIAEHSTIPRLRAELDLTLDWRGFELHPQTPKGGMELTQIVPKARADVTRMRMRRLSESFGIQGMGTPEHIPSTRRILATAELARDRGCLDAFREAAMIGHWEQALDLEDPTDIASIATTAGLDPAAAVAAGEDGHYLSRIDAIREEAGRMGVTGVPTFFFGNVAVVGCQPYDDLLEAALVAGAKPRPGAASVVSPTAAG
jgi:predicted DsbA family dithiol-disulfide isomerase